MSEWFIFSEVELRRQITRQVHNMYAATPSSCSWIRNSVCYTYEMFDVTAIYVAHMKCLMSPLRMLHIWNVWSHRYICDAYEMFNVTAIYVAHMRCLMSPLRMLHIWNVWSHRYICDAYEIFYVTAMYVTHMQYLMSPLYMLRIWDVWSHRYVYLVRRGNIKWGDITCTANWEYCLKSKEKLMPLELSNVNRKQK
jgi:hypothetical protein